MCGILGWKPQNDVTWFAYIFNKIDLFIKAVHVERVITACTHGMECVRDRIGVSVVKTGKTWSVGIKW